MTDYTLTNLREIDDSAGDSAPDLEARFGRKHLDSEHLGVSHFRAGPGFRSEKGHSHREQEEVYIVVAGSGRIKLNDEIVELRPWDAVRCSGAGGSRPSCGRPSRLPSSPRSSVDRAVVS